ncbi:MAG: hypothetical protein QF437_30060 [Planctomycetota bacterium]|jgi:hypothetical protein|nr:hypothetical protein [Planctomycetota bacterium]MDP7423636.1 hypothetical protein [bacterium]
MKKNILIAVLLTIIGAGGAFLYLRMTRSPGSAGTTSAADFCVKHQIAEANCPWCDPSLVEKNGQCSGHGVAEALCVKCNPALMAGFKAENDWCAGHSVPESQCALCDHE